MFHPLLGERAGVRADFYQIYIHHSSQFLSAIIMIQMAIVYFF